MNKRMNQARGFYKFLIFVIFIFVFLGFLPQRKFVLAKCSKINEQCDTSWAWVGFQCDSHSGQCENKDTYKCAVRQGYCYTVYKCDCDGSDCCSGGGGGSTPEDPPCGMITVSPDLDDVANQKYKLTNVKATDPFINDGFDRGPGGGGIDLCYFGRGGGKTTGAGRFRVCYWSARNRWDEGSDNYNRYEGNFIYFGMSPYDSGNITLYFKAPDDYLITRIEFDYEKDVERNGEDRADFGLSPEVRFTRQDNLHEEEAFPIPVNGPDTGHLSFDMKPATKYIYFYGEGKGNQMVFSNIKFDLIKVEKTDKPTVDVITNLYQCGGSDPLDPEHTATCSRKSHHCVEKICLNQDQNWGECDWRYIYDTDSGQILQDPIYGFPYEIDDSLVSGGKATIYAKACTKYGDNWCAVFSDSINYLPKYPPECTSANQMSVPLDVAQGEVVSISPNVSDPDGAVARVEFYYTSSGASDYCTASWTKIGEDTNGSDGWSIDWDTSGIPEGDYVIRADAYDNEGNWCTGNPGGTCGVADAACQDCRATTTIKVVADAWFQTQGGDVHAQGSITDPIPASAVDGPYCSLKGEGGYPGVVSYGGTGADFSPGGSASEIGWLANSSYGGKTYGYAYFNSLIDSPQSLSENPSASELNALDGFYKVEGNLSLPDSTLNINSPDQKVVILVTGNLTIRERINLGTNNNFLAFIVGGDIVIDSDVTDAGANPALEGIYIADGTISTGESDNKLTGEGMFIASGFDLDRDLGADNNTTPAETFIFRPDLWFNAPQDFWKASFTWQELAP